MQIHYAPWSGRFKTLCFAGLVAYEVQLGPLVIQWFYKHHRQPRPLGRLRLWRDPFWRA